MIYVQSGKKPRRGGRIGLALGGGGPVGLVYEIGVLSALEDAFTSVDLTALHSYIGVSAGAPNVAYLASGVSPARMREMLVEEGRGRVAADLERTLSISPRKLLGFLLQLPRAYWSFFWHFVTDPRDKTLAGALTSMADTLHFELFDGAKGERLARRLLESEGHTDDFRELGKRLYIVATNVDTGEAVKFGSPGFDHIPISTAIRASTSVPGLFSPVEIDGEWYFDGGTGKTFHASTLYEAGADLIICINPLVPYDARVAEASGREPRSVLQGGTRAIAMQAAFQVVHSRLELGLAQYVHDYPDRELVLIEPDAGDEELFFVNLWGIAERRQLFEYGYRSTMRNIAARRDVLEPVLSRHGIRLRKRLPTRLRARKRPAIRRPRPSRRGAREVR